MARRKITAAAIAKGAADELPDLTANQQEFVRHLLSGKTASDAYKAAYDCSNMAANSIYCEASKLRSNPKIAQWLSQAKVNGLERMGLSRDEWLRMVLASAEEAKRDGNHGANMDGLKTIGKSLGFLIDQVQSIGPDNPLNTLDQIARESPEAAAALAALTKAPWKPDDQHTRH